MLDRVTTSVAKGLTTAALILMTSPLVALADTEAIKAGIELYNRKDYQGAVKHLERALKRGANSAQVHYYYANTLVFLKRPPEAMAHYLRCYQIDPGSSFGVYSAMAIKTHEMSRGKRAGRQSAISGEGANAGASANGSSAAATGAQESRLANLQKAIAIIESQGVTAQNNAVNESDARARDNLKRGEYRAIDLQREADAITDMMRGARVIDGVSVRRYSQSEIEAVARRYQHRISDARSRAAAEAQSEQEYGMRHANNVGADLANLEKQLSDENGAPNSPHLQPVGTNLYVRMYASPHFVPNTAPPEELVATQDRLVIEKYTKPGSKRTHVEPAESLADQGKLVIESTKSASAAPNLQVSGRLLHVH